jgi:hypothetical protein
LRQPFTDIAILKDSDAAVSYGFEGVYAGVQGNLNATGFSLILELQHQGCAPDPRLD